MEQFSYFLLHIIRIYSHGVKLSCLLSDLIKHEARFCEVLAEHLSAGTQESHGFPWGICCLNTCVLVCSLHQSNLASALCPPMLQT